MITIEQGGGVMNLEEKNNIIARYEGLIKSAERNLKQLKEDLEEFKEKKPTEERERLEAYHYVQSDGAFIWRDKDRGVTFDNWNYSIGNYFATREEVERYRERLIITQKLKDLASEINPELVDWENEGQDKYYIYYSHAGRRFDISSTDSIRRLNIYSTNEAFLKIALEIIGEDNLKKLFEVDKRKERTKGRRTYPTISL